MVTVKARERQLRQAHRAAVDELARANGKQAELRAKRKVESAWRSLSAWLELEKYR